MSSRDTFIVAMIGAGFLFAVSVSNCPQIFVFVFYQLPRALWRRLSGRHLDPPPYGRGRCKHCGYILRGLPENRCPECGALFDKHKDP